MVDIELILPEKVAPHAVFYIRYASSNTEGEGGSIWN